MQYGQKAMDKLFWEIEALMVRTLRAVDRLVINDQQSFEVSLRTASVQKTVDWCALTLPSLQSQFPGLDRSSRTFVRSHHHEKARS